MRAVLPNRSGPAARPPDPATVAHRKPTRPQPSRSAAAATTTPDDSVDHHQAPYSDQRLPSPASMPNSVACMQNPASPSDSSTLTTPAARRRRAAPTAARCRRSRGGGWPLRHRRPPTWAGSASRSQAGTHGARRFQRTHLTGGFPQQSGRPRRSPGRRFPRRRRTARSRPVPAGGPRGRAPHNRRVR